MADQLKITMAADLEKDIVSDLTYLRIISSLMSLVIAWPRDALGGTLSLPERVYGVFLPCLWVFVMFGEFHYMVTNDLDFLMLGDTVLVLCLTSIQIVRLIIPLLKGYKEVVRDFLRNFHLTYFKHRGIHFAKLQTVTYGIKSSSYLATRCLQELADRFGSDYPLAAEVLTNSTYVDDLLAGAMSIADALQVHKTVEKVCRYMTFYIASTSIFGALLFNVSPFYLNYKNGAFSSERKPNVTEFHAAVYISYSFFDPFENIKVTSAFGLFCSLVVAISLCVMDLLLMLMAFHIIGHIVILRRNLESITGPEKSETVTFNRENSLVAVKHEVFTKEENSKIHLVLKDCVEHHLVIVRFTDKMSDFFGIMLACNYIFELVSLCILLLESTQGSLNALIRFGPLTLIVFGQLIQISVIFEVVGTVSDKLPEALYCIPWECMDVSNQKSVCILLQRLQRPINITAMGMTTVGVTTMAGILKTTFSYFAFLRTLNE